MMQQFLAARNASVPILSIVTPDPEAAIQRLAVAMVTPKKVPAVIRWDMIRGFRAVNEAAKAAVLEVAGENPALKSANPTAAVQLALNFPEDALVILQSAHRLLDNPQFAQAVWNVRDPFKANGRMLVLLGPEMKLPAELKSDVVALREELPSQAQLEAIVRDQCEQHRAQVAGVPELDAATLATAVDATLGLPAFEAEQAVAMSLDDEKGLRTDLVWERKRQSIEQAGDGLYIERGGQTFADCGGCEAAKLFFTRLNDGPNRPRIYVVIDEAEKAFAGSGAQGDSSGVSRGMLGHFCSWTTGSEVVGVTFTGPAGTAKTLIATAAANQAGALNVRMDLGAAKDGTVGSSERNFRRNTGTLDAMAQGKGRIVVIATTNSTSEFPMELKRRLGFARFYFDLPTDIEKAAIWPIQMRRFSLPDQPLPAATNWTGDEIRRCCEFAWRLGISLIEAAQYVVPVAISDTDKIRELRAGASGRYLSASRPGIYQWDELAAGSSSDIVTSTSRRKRQGA